MINKLITTIGSFFTLGVVRNVDEPTTMREPDSLVTLVEARINYTPNRTRKGALKATRDKVKTSSGSVLATGQVTAAQLNKHFAKYKNGRLQGKGQVFIDMEKKYGISAKFMASIATLESGAGTSKRARTKNDCFGMTGYGKKKSWASIEANIECAYSLMYRKYIKENRTTVTSISRKYCERSAHWAKNVSSIMNRI